ncbi:DNA primase [Bauldia sp.]|uniref:DNA primase n=1 Tax=Bauldia sp. TaxID=2575872 RepID=UPI003BAB29C2
MRFSDSLLDDIRARLPVSEVVRQRVRLKKEGREWRGLSPFNSEKTPSFFVNDQKGFYHDFSAGKNGDIFTFVMETEGLSFPEAVEKLARLAGVNLPTASAADRKKEQRRKSLAEILQLASDFFRENLKSDAGGEARAYLETRGVSQSTQAEFSIGYAPAGRAALRQYLASKDVPLQDMIDAGLLISGDDIPVAYDRFRDRVIIPIHDVRGRVIGFGGRALNDAVKPKYLNSPETELFHKGSVVFNFHRARQPAHDDGSVVVVEGYLDAISIYQAGMRSVVASMGTALTEAQIGTLWRLSDEPIVCFDSDRAGISAAHRSIDRILPQLRVGKAFSFAFLVQGKDPDELVRSQGLEAFRAVLQGAHPLWDVLWERELAQARIDTPDGRAAFEKRLYDIVRSIKDQTVNTAYYRTCRVELSNLFWRELKSASKEKERGSFLDTHVRIPEIRPKFGIYKILLGLLVHYPEFIDDKPDRFSNLDFPGDLESFYRALHYLTVDGAEITVEVIYAQLSDEFFHLLDDVHGDASTGVARGHRLIERFPIVGASPPLSFVSECVNYFVKRIETTQMQQDVEELERRLARDTVNVDAILEQLGRLTGEIQRQENAWRELDKNLAEEAQGIRRLGNHAPSWSLQTAA